MPKLKTKGSVKKRFKLTGSGKIRRRRANHSHILTKKNAKRKRRLRSGTLVTSVDEKRINRLLEGH
jgi:large subunit ribosomal protein L35